jgi:hypothetical protein
MGITIAKLLVRPALHVWIREAAAVVEDYVVDWTARLPAGEHINASTFELPKGDLVAEKASNSIELAIVRISGGTAGHAYEIVNRITTSTGRQLQQAIRLRVKR